MPRLILIQAIQAIAGPQSPSEQKSQIKTGFIMEVYGDGSMSVSVDGTTQICRPSTDMPLFSGQECYVSQYDNSKEMVVIGGK